MTRHSHGSACRSSSWELLQQGELAHGDRAASTAPEAAQEPPQKGTLQKAPEHTVEQTSLTLCTGNHRRQIQPSSSPAVVKRNKGRAGQTDRAEPALLAAPRSSPATPSARALPCTAQLVLNMPKQTCGVMWALFGPDLLLPPSHVQHRAGTALHRSACFGMICALPKVSVVIIYFISASIILYKDLLLV